MIIMLIQVCGWCISNLAFFLIFSFIIDPLIQWLFAAIFNCLVCAAASTDPIVLFYTSEEYQKAFFKQFSWLSLFHKPNINTVIPQNTTGIITRINVKQVTHDLG